MRKTCSVSPRCQVWSRGCLRSLSFMILLGGLAGHSAPAQEAARERDRAPSPSRVTLSTAGLAEYVFAFPVENEATVGLALETADVDDVLKSLVVRDPAGSGHKVSLPSENSLAELFRGLPVQPDDLQSLIQLLETFRGETVTVESASGGQATGLVIGTRKVPVPAGEGAVIEQEAVLLMEDDGKLRQVMLTDARVLFGTPAQDALRRAVAGVASARRKDTKEIHLTLNGRGSRTVEASWVASSPVWKTAWRLILPETGPGRLLGWAVVQNATPLDWRGVQLSLVSGAPLAYRQRLYEIVRLERPLAPLPTLERFRPRVDEGTVPAPAPARSAMPRMLSTNEAKSDKGANDSSPPVPLLPEEQAAAVRESIASVAFTVPQPVDLLAGHTLALPFLERSMETERVSLYQPDVSSDRVTAAVRIRNDSSSTLPPGLVTIYDRTGYVGDARFVGAPPGEARMLIYAVDPKTKVSREQRVDELVERVVANAGVIEATLTRRNITSYAAISTNEEAGASRLVIEHPKQAGAERIVSSSSGQPEVADTRSHLRITTPLPRSAAPDAPVRIEIVEEQPIVQRVQVLGSDPNLLVRLTNARLDRLDPASRNHLQALVQARRDGEEAKRKIAEADERAERIQRDQDRLRANMQSVQDASLRATWLSRMREQEQEMEAISRQREDGMRGLADAERRSAEALRALQK
jgi:hypothetical protein